MTKIIKKKVLKNYFYNSSCEKSPTYKVKKRKEKKYKKVQDNDTIKANMILHYISLLKLVIFSHSVL